MLEIHPRVHTLFLFSFFYPARISIKINSKRSQKASNWITHSRAGLGWLLEKKEDGIDNRPLLERKKRITLKGPAAQKPSHDDIIIITMMMMIFFFVLFILARRNTQIFYWLLYCPSAGVGYSSHTHTEILNIQDGTSIIPFFLFSFFLPDQIESSYYYYTITEKSPPPF